MPEGRAWPGLAAMASVCLALLLGAGAAEAQTSVQLVSNTGQTSAGGRNSTFDRAQAFTTGSYSGGYKLTGVDIDLKLSGSALATHAVTLRSDSFGVPSSTSLGTLTKASLSNGTNRFTASGTGIDLTANTTYFVLIDFSGQGATNLKTDDTDSDAEDSGAAAGWSIADTSVTRPIEGGAWTTRADAMRIAVHGHAKAPTVTGVAITSNAGTDLTYQKDDRIRVTATFNVPVTVDTTGGTPHLIFHLVDGPSATQRNRLALYESGSGTNALVFGYTVLSGDNSGSSGIVLPANAIRLNSGTIKDAAGTVDATLTYSTVPVNTNHRTNGSTSATKPAATARSCTFPGPSPSRARRRP